jgi:uncharacterized OB-fold protein
MGSHEVVADEAGILRLCGMRCGGCGLAVFPRGAGCPSCLSADLAALPLSSVGTLYSYTTVHVAPANLQTPYVVGYVDFPEGVRVFGKVRAEAAALRPDMPVSVRFAEAPMPEKGLTGHRYYFEPASEASR